MTGPCPDAGHHTIAVLQRTLLSAEKQKTPRRTNPQGALSKRSNYQFVSTNSARAFTLSGNSYPISFWMRALTLTRNVFWN